MIDIVFSPILVKKFASFSFYLEILFLDKNIGLEWSGGLKYETDYEIWAGLDRFGILEFLNFFHFL